jgi:peptide-methionine (S)-S-oxide reductase
MPDPASTPRPRPPLDRAAPDALVPAVFGLGCFWGPDARFGAVAGVVRTCVGYAGGASPAPTYDALGDHIETVRVEYDPERISYAELLLLFWASHDPTRPPFKRQYQPALFPQTERQARLAAAARDARAAELDASLTTVIIEDASFHRAEDRHQKHALRRYPRLRDAVRAPYPDGESFVDAPAAALVNGYAGGCRAPRHLAADAPRLGLPAAATDRLRTVAQNRFG